MYLYFALVSMDRGLRQYGHWVTKLQLIQFWITFFSSIFWLVYKRNEVGMLGAACITPLVRSTHTAAFAVVLVCWVPLRDSDVFLLLDILPGVQSSSYGFNEGAFFVQSDEKR